MTFNPRNPRDRMRAIHLLAEFREHDPFDLPPGIGVPSHAPAWTTCRMCGEATITGEATIAHKRQHPCEIGYPHTAARLIACATHDDCGIFTPLPTCDAHEHEQLHAQQTRLAPLHALYVSRL